MIYLYVKTHNRTGLKYFGKTTRKDPFKYKGSGIRWRNHLAKHGNDVNTDIIASFEDHECAKEFAIKFSLDNNIVESSEWANLKIEELEGGWSHITNSIRRSNHEKIKGLRRTEEQRKRISDNHYDVSGANNPMYGKTHSEESIRKMQIPKSEEHKQNLRLSALKRSAEGKLYCQSEDGRNRSRKQMLEYSANGNHPFNGTISVFNIETKRGERVSKDEYQNNREKYVGNNSKIRKEITNAFT